MNGKPRNSTASPPRFVETIDGQRLQNRKSKYIFFSQGDASNAIYFIRQGSVKLTVVSKRGKEAIVGILEENAFFGEQSLAGEPIRVMTATAAEDCVILKFDRLKMLRSLRDDSAMSERFISFLLSRNQRIQEDLVDHLFNNSEKRLARLLLLLAHYGSGDESDGAIPKINQETLAEMVGTTRGRVSFFMHKFRKLGFIHDSGGLKVHSSLLNMILHD